MNNLRNSNNNREQTTNNKTTTMNKLRNNNNNNNNNNEQTMQQQHKHHNWNAGGATNFFFLKCYEERDRNDGRRKEAGPHDVAQDVVFVVPKLGVGDGRDFESRCIVVLHPNADLEKLWNIQSHGDDHHG